jgi:hypothetical protein
MNLEARRRVLPENDNEIGFAMMQLGATYYNLQRYDDAVALLDKTTSLGFNRNSNISHDMQARPCLV